jgi:large subunit ribosomal protein L29
MAGPACWPARTRGSASLPKDFMKFSEMKDMTLVELAAKSRDFRHEMFNLRLQQASAQLEKPARLRVLRKDIARLETRISELRNKAKTA